MIVVAVIITRAVRNLAYQIGVNSGDPVVRLPAIVGYRHLCPWCELLHERTNREKLLQKIHHFATPKTACKIFCWISGMTGSETCGSARSKFSNFVWVLLLAIWARPPPG